MERGRCPEPYLVRVEEIVNGMGQALLDHTGKDFVDRVGKRNGAIAGRRSAVLLIAFINHNYVTEVPMVRGSAQHETIM